MTKFNDKIEQGDKKYWKFIEDIGLDCKEIMTPHTKSLERLGNLDYGSKKFILSCIEEIHDNFFTICCQRERR
ncbi:MAG: hypothetical protein ACOCV1_06700 [Bacillota bacterium]